MAVDFSFPAWLRDQHSFADSLAKGAQVGAIIANNRYRNQALAAQAIQAEREYELRDRQLAAQEKTADLDYRLKSRLIEDQVADKETITGWIETVSSLPLAERISVPMPKNLRLAQSYGIVNQVRDNDLNAFNATVQRDKGFAPGDLEKDIRFYQDVLREGDPKIIGLTQSLLEAKGTKLGFSMEFNPDGTISRVLQGPMSAGAVPTTGFKGKLQEQLHGTAGTLELLATMQQNMGSSDFGLPGIARDLKVRLGPLFGMDVSDEDLSVRKTIPLLRAALQKELKSDSNITEAERKDIAKALPSESWLESKESAQQSLNVLIPWLKNRVVRNAEALSIPVPRSAMTADQVRAAYESGEMTLDEARDTIKRFGIQIPRLPQDEGPAPMIENAR